MFVGFNVKIGNQEMALQYFYEKGFELYTKHKKDIAQSLDKYTLENGKLNAFEIEKDWFPSIKADVFLSHSHKDEKLAISFAGWLFTVFGIVTFIDSCVWGYSNNLLKLIDDKYCVQSEKASGDYIYDYDKRNNSTSHIHMILNGALAKMIDSTECLMFLNTPNSLSTSNVIEKSETASPWIYSELLLSKIVRHKKLIEYRRRYLLENFAHSQDSLEVNYDIEIDHLIELDYRDLSRLWKNQHNNKFEVLDSLYFQKKILLKEGNDIYA